MGHSLGTQVEPVIAMTDSTTQPTTFPAIQRRFVTIADGAGRLRQVHLRIAGQGPPILLLHQSPRDGGELEPLMARLTGDVPGGAMVIAPDSPGYGLSDPLPASPADLPGTATDMDAYADGLTALMDRLGIGRAAVYGLHTGGCIALRLAVRHPDRVAGLVVDGVLLLTEGERADYLAHYLPPFQPVWHGTHLVWAWARLREQALFFPWYRAAGETRMVRNPPPPERLQMLLLELLRAGDHYRGAYGAALAQDVAGDIGRLRVPAQLLSSRDDVLVTQIDRMPPLPPDARMAVPQDRAAAADLTVAGLMAAVRDLPPWTGVTGPDPVPDQPADRPLNRFVPTRDGWLRLRVTGAGGFGAGPVVVLIPDADGGAVPLDGTARALAAGGATVIVPDPPGSGESTAPPPAVTDGPPDRLLSWQGERIADALAALAAERGGGRPGPILLLARGHAAALALAVAAASAAAGRVAATVLWDPPVADAAGREERAAHHAPDLTPDPQGAHLLRAWHRLRNDGLFDPWYRETAGTVVAHPDRLAPDRLQDRLIPLLAGAPSHRARVRAESLAPLATAIQAAPGPVLIALTGSTPAGGERADDAGPPGPSHPLAAATGCPVLILPPEMASCPVLLAQALGIPTETPGEFPVA
ncbi:MAG: hypothetical protein RLY86_3528 [Pseudomonadota bacterium]|jgi:pimeloyl-ACP methyl ester carboxylesterase